MHTREASPAVRNDNPESELPVDFSLTKEEKGTEGMEKQEVEGPSAADYDPTMDMEEDKKRMEQRLHDGEVSSAAYDETESNARDVLVPETEMEIDQKEEHEEAEGKDDDFDMFADDDDDMFAEGPLKPKPKQTTSKAVPVVTQSKQLDASMLDNWDDSEGYYRVILAELLEGRYHVQANLGKGMFSGVVRALDMKTQKFVAIKIIRNNETM